MKGNSEEKDYIPGAVGALEDKEGVVTMLEIAAAYDEINGKGAAARALGATKDSPLYPQDPINGFLQGCLLDLRVRLAIDFLKSPLFTALTAEITNQMHEANVRAEEAVAGFSLNLADEILKQGAARGWVTPISEDGEIGPALRAQAKRNALYQVVQQLEANKAAQAEQNPIAVPVAPMPGRKMN
jgi:hypothetical protein